MLNVANVVLVESGVIKPGITWTCKVKDCEELHVEVIGDHAGMTFSFDGVATGVWGGSVTASDFVSNFILVGSHEYQFALPATAYICYRLYRRQDG